MLLDDLDEAADEQRTIKSAQGVERPAGGDARVIELCKEGQVVDVRYEDRNVLLECPKALLNRVNAAGVAPAITASVVVAPLVVVAAIVALVARASNVELRLLRLGVIGRAVLEQDIGVRRQAGDETLGRTNTMGELLGLRSRVQAKQGRCTGASTTASSRRRA